MEIKKVLIVGGGTAGMMTAALLSKVFKDKIEITVVHSNKIGTIGVGESSTASLHSFMKYIGLEEKDWMEESSAVYKYGGRFMNWSNSGDHFVLVENEARLYVNKTTNLLQHLSTNYPNDPHKIKDIFVTPQLALKNLSPRIDDDLAYSPTYNDIESIYSYNFDALKFADVIKRKVCIPNGVKFIEGDLKQVKLDEFGYIKDIKLWDQTKHKADLYIDCSGFKGALIESVMGEPFIPFSESLFCDKAIAAPIPYKDKATEMEPYSRLYTMNSGWLWKTPIYDRIGSGYVYSSKYITDEDAEKEFREFHGGYEGNVMKINMRIGTRERVAVKNVVACGLAGGFAEPMESTGISTFQGIMSTLATELEKSNLNYNSQIVDAINRDNIDMMIDIRDFIQAHYLTCERNDTEFWRDCKTKALVPDTLMQKLHIMAVTPPEQLFRGRIFGSVNWFQWLWATNYFNNNPFGIKTKFKLDPKYFDYCEGKIELIKHEAKLLTGLLPNMYDYLKKVYGRD
jgi:tryptophan halogenase